MKTKNATNGKPRATKATGLRLAKEHAGGSAALGRIVGLSRQAVSKWTEIPPERVVLIAKKTGIDRALLRPDLYA